MRGYRWAISCIFAMAFRFAVSRLYFWRIQRTRQALMRITRERNSQGLKRPVESGRGAVLTLRSTRFPDPLAAPGVRLSPHRALHVSYPLVNCQ